MRHFTAFRAFHFRWRDIFLARYFSSREIARLQAGPILAAICALSRAQITIYFRDYAPRLLMMLSPNIFSISRRFSIWARVRHFQRTVTADSQLPFSGKPLCTPKFSGFRAASVMSDRYFAKFHQSIFTRSVYYLCHDEDIQCRSRFLVAWLPEDIFHQAYNTSARHAQLAGHCRLVKRCIVIFGMRYYFQELRRLLLPPPLKRCINAKEKNRKMPDFGTDYLIYYDSHASHLIILISRP